jgi:predicted methyltransferase
MLRNDERRVKPIVLSHFQVRPIIAARQAGKGAIACSLDLGLTTSEVTLQPDRVILPGGQGLAWASLQTIVDNEVACCVIEDNAPRKIQFFSGQSNCLYSLMPTHAAPTMLISGIPMHRIKDTDPYQDTLTKIRAAAPIHGRVLDTATGLGYTAIEAAKTADEVITIEIDSAALQVARLNPWSQALFDNPKIRQISGDAFDEVQAFEDASFNRIIHDPPMFSLAGDLYSAEFYRQLYRVLKSNGRVFHYIGDLDSSSGQRVSKGVIRRLQDAGFARVIRQSEAFGVLAYKSR